MNEYKIKYEISVVVNQLVVIASQRLINGRIAIGKCAYNFAYPHRTIDFQELEEMKKMAMREMCRDEGIYDGGRLTFFEEDFKNV